MVGCVCTKLGTRIIPQGKERQPALVQKIEKRVFSILQSWQKDSNDDNYSVTHSSWWGACIFEQEYGTNYNNRTTDREDYFIFCNNSNNTQPSGIHKFMLKFKRNHEVDHVASDGPTYGINQNANSDDDSDDDSFAQFMTWEKARNNNNNNNDL
mmetsp:Transcript_26072/g.29291  ORF Transcript_26072/g.29291 Transcript_26072/m.29291 type:complete len:154 (+) Transcript_26072:124-585(+)